MKKLGWSAIFLLFSVVEVQVQAADEEAVVIEVRKNIALSKNEKIYKNYFINGGANFGLGKGAIVDVLRRLPIHDPLKNASIGDLRVKVGELEIIHSEDKLSIARQVIQESPENRPILDYEAVMVGDRLDLKTLRQPHKEEKKVALLAHPNKAQNLIKEGEQHLATLSNLKSSAKPTPQQPVKSADRQVASLPGHPKEMAKAPRKTVAKKKVMLKKKNS